MLSDMTLRSVLAAATATVLLGSLSGCFGGDDPDGPTLRLEADPTASYSDQQLDSVPDVLQQRLEVLGHGEATVDTELATEWVVHLPDDAQDLTADELVAPGGAEFRQVLAVADSADAKPSQPDAVVLADETGEMFLELGRPEINSDQVEETKAESKLERAPGWLITVRFDDDGAAAWERLTAAAACKTGDLQRIAIVVGDAVVSSPMVQATPCEDGIKGDATEITGNFKRDEAEELAAQIAFDPLPVSLRDAG
jgi:SecD/SecF fusion protein